jgi:hypothetical protein
MSRATLKSPVNSPNLSSRPGEGEKSPPAGSSAPAVSEQDAIKQQLSVLRQKYASLYEKRNSDYDAASRELARLHAEVRALADQVK